MKIKYTKLPPAPAKYPRKSRLNFLIKGQGPFDEEQAARTCTRCGACLQKCPSFRTLKNEIYSPRGRAQLLRFFFEKKLTVKQDKKDILNSVRSCFMCGSCTALCPAKTPVSDLMFSFGNALGGRAKTKRSALLRAVYLTAAKLKIKNALKKQKDGDKKIIFAPSFYASSQIKNIADILNSSGFKAEADFSAMNLEVSYFSSNIKQIKKALSALLKTSRNSPERPIVTDGWEAYAILKKASLFGQDFSPLESRVKFLTEYIVPAGKFKETIHFKKVVVCRNDIDANAEFFTEQISQLLICPKKFFLIECIQSKELPPAAAAHWVKTKGEDAVKKQSALNLCDIGADCIIVCSHTDKKLFENLTKRQSPRPVVLHISQIPEVFYAKD